MNTAALKAFAPLVRRQLMEAVARKLDFVLTAQTPDYLTTFAPQVAKLRALAGTDRAGLIEKVAYTWFNRLAALRYLDARGWHPFRGRVLTAASPEETQPELLKLVRSGALPAELKTHCPAARLDDLLDGRIPSPDPQGEVYRYLVLAACRYYNALLPELFEKLDDQTELLLPDDLLTEQAVAHGFRTEITDEDCAEVEVLGWLYQFYISEKKDAVMGRKAAVPTEDIPAVTQLFTPHWIVRYLVENSLGRLWLLNRPGSRLRAQMPYYIEGEAETDFLRIGKPEEIRVLDPAVGSGHMLTYAFDLLYAIYEEEGYAPSEIPGQILRHNLNGIDICPRAAQLAALALVLKAREKSRRFFQAGQLVHPQILCMEDVRFSEGELRDYVEALDLGNLFSEPVMELFGEFDLAATVGSLVQPCVDANGLAFTRAAIEASDIAGNLFLSDTHTKIRSALAQAEAISRRYHVVVANPPYMGNGGMGLELKSFAATAYPDSKSDLFAMFMERARSLTIRGGYSGMVTMQNWMFLSSFEQLRKDLIGQQNLITLVQIGFNSFPEMNSKIAQACAFVVANARVDRVGTYLNLNDAPPTADKNSVFLEKLQRNEMFRVPAQNFRKMPGTPIAYWASEAMLRLYSEPPLASFATPRQGLATGDNDQFLRYWHEVEISHIGQDMSSVDEANKSGLKWFPITKGGSFRRWYGNKDFVVNWENDGEAIRCFGIDSNGGRARSRAQNTQYYFMSGASWSTISSGPISFRLSERSIFETKGSTCFTRDGCSLSYLLAVLNSKVTQELLTVASPTLDYHEGPLSKIPFKSGVAIPWMERSVSELVRIAKGDWDAFETSSGFRSFTLIRSELSLLRESWQNWKTRCDAAIRRMQELETENNRLFIEAYGLQDELSPEVPEEQITLARANPRKDMAALLSYVVGCMMGRYSLDKPGLILANAGDTLERYVEIVGKAQDELRFVPDEDGIVPVLDGEWFADDIVARTREFLRAAFPEGGEAGLRENVRFLEESLGKDLRKYFLTDFYKDHLQTYKKRPIYWLVQSPRKGFSVLIYLHRYTRDTMNRVLNKYLREYQVKLRGKAEQLAQVETKVGGSAREKAEARKEKDRVNRTLHECEEWERQTLLPLAQARIELDLDDGVKVNYLKLGEALATVPGLEGKGEE